MDRDDPIDDPERLRQRVACAREQVRLRLDRAGPALLEEVRAIEGELEHLGAARDAPARLGLLDVIFRFEAVAAALDLCPPPWRARRRVRKSR